jgi:phosphate transport system substrate-binding protein
MNTNESNSKGSVICGWCSYDENPLGAEICRKCGKSLIVNSSVPRSNQVNKSRFGAYVGLLGLTLTLLFFSGLGYYFWQFIFVTSSSSLITSSNKNSSDIRLYNSMKEVPNVPEGTFNYNGAPLFASLVAQGTHKAIKQAYPQFRLSHFQPPSGDVGSGPGITMLLNGQISIALSAKPLDDDHYNKAMERGFRLEQIPIAIDGFGAFTHPDVSIPGLSIEQIQAIYQGKITNWKEVGGPNLRIIPIIPSPKTGAGILKILFPPEIGSISPKVQVIDSFGMTEHLRKVGSTPGAIGIGSSSLIVGQSLVRPIAIAPAQSKEYVPMVIDDKVNAAAFRDNTYPLTRRVFVIIRRDDKLDEQAGVAYANLLLSKEGQQFVEKSGMVAVR